MKSRTPATLSIFSLCLHSNHTT